MTARPAESLEGLTLNDRWKVVSLITRPLNATGGAFSVGYEVRDSNDRRAFLKAFDFSQAISSRDVMNEILKLTQSFVWERDLLNKCREKKMGRVSTAIESGSVAAPGALGPDALVYYLIFEWAEGGDLRQQLNSLTKLDVPMALISLKHAALGLQQLHRHSIFHQDLKPSNVLMFQSKEFKVADLGRSTDAASPAVHDSFQVPGDGRHAPPEQFYSIGRHWTLNERKAADLYQLGSLIFFNFTGLTARDWLSKIITDAGMKIHPTDFAMALPNLRAAFSKSLLGLENEIRSFSITLKNDIMQLATQLCEPNPEQRGSLRHKFTNGQFEVERYASKISSLVKRIELGMI